MATAVFPVCRSPMMSSRCPRPIGTIASIAFSPVCSGSFTGCRSTTPGANGTVTIDAPAVAPGTRLSSPYVLTYDGITGGTPTWVDHAPGGEAPADPSVGADYLDRYSAFSDIQEVQPRRLHELEAA